MLVMSNLKYSRLLYIYIYIFHFPKYYARLCCESVRYNLTYLLQLYVESGYDLDG